MTSLGLILVVDDDIGLLNMMQMVLQEEGYEVMTAEDGAIALEIIQKHPPRLILLDMFMPNMDGWEFVRQFRTRYGHQIPILIVTAASDARQWGKAMGANGWIGKPFVLEHLIETVANCIKKD
ncbi:MAG: response regulator [Chloroflexi bacterium]|nr:response regulator [Chloroflexota bacterium]